MPTEKPKYFFFRNNPINKWLRRGFWSLAVVLALSAFLNHLFPHTGAGIDYGDKFFSLVVSVFTGYAVTYIFYLAVTRPDKYAQDETALASFELFYKVVTNSNELKNLVLTSEACQKYEQKKNEKDHNRYKINDEKLLRLIKLRLRYMYEALQTCIILVSQSRPVLAQYYKSAIVPVIEAQEFVMPNQLNLDFTYIYFLHINLLQGDGSEIIQNDYPWKDMDDVISAYRDCIAESEKIRGLGIQVVNITRKQQKEKDSQSPTN